MKFCSKCGKELVDEAVICINCGCSVASPTASNTNVAANDAPNTGLGVLGFFIPIVGLILYIVNMNTYPLKAKSAGKGALIGFCVSIVLSIIYAVILGVIIGLELY